MTARAPAIVAACAALSLLSCDRAPPAGRAPAPAPATAPATAPEPWSDAWVAREGERYLSDPAWRRRALETSLQSHDNTYARQRLTHYGLVTGGWDALPEWNPRSRPVTTDDVRVANEASPLAPPPSEPLWDRARPSTREGWAALGREVFERYPLRVEVFMEWGLRHPEALSAAGVRPGPDGRYPGLVAFRDIDGRARVGITCALCHTDPSERGVVYGRARRDFDYGRLRLAFHRDTGVAVDPELARRMATWGPGRADVTEDEAEDPVAIPDLWGLRHQQSLTQAGTIRHVGPAALAIRQETQLLDSNHQRVRPPRELAWALAVYLYGLEPPPRDPETSPRDGASLARGRELFTQRCASCHSNPAYGGPPVPAERVGTHPALARGSARGTGLYRPPALIRVADAAPYLHDASVATLDALFSPARVGQGHPWGTRWPDDERRDLVAWLRTL